MKYLRLDTNIELSCILSLKPIGINYFFLNQEEIIAGCKRGDRLAQKKLYEAMSAKMFGVCSRYLRDDMEAEDAIINGLFKVFDKIHTYQGNGSFEGWIRRIVINECLMMLRRYNLNLSVEVKESDAQVVDNIEHQIAEHEILGLLDRLPPGYRTVFNLYVIEGYEHHEIAELLHVSINTSKSQLIKARKKLQELLLLNGFKVA